MDHNQETRGVAVATEIAETAWLDSRLKNGVIQTPAPDEETFSIGDLARECGVTQRTLRFYENRGLLTPQRRGALRIYSKRDRDRLALIAHGKRLGFTLAEIREMIAAKSVAGDRNVFDLTRAKCVEQINLLSRQKREIESAIAELRQIYTSFYTARIAEEAGEG